MRILLQFVAVLGLLLPFHVLAADVRCVGNIVPSEFLQRMTLTSDAKETITREYQKQLGAELPKQPICTKIAIVGPIQSGDYDDFASIYRASRGWLGDVVLVSYGGSLDEAIRIGRLIKSAFMATHAPYKFSEDSKPSFGGMEPNPCENHDCVCASACFVIWVAGLPRYGNALGIHRPAFDAKYFGNLSPSTAEKKYQQAIQELAQYLQDMAVPQTYYELLMKTPSWEVLIPWQSIKRDLESPRGLAATHNPSAIDEWLTAKCGAVSVEELAALEEYDAKTGRKYMLTFTTPSKWSELPDPAYRLLAKKIYEITSCRFANRVTVQFERYRNIVAGH